MTGSAWISPLRGSRTARLHGLARLTPSNCAPSQNTSPRDTVSRPGRGRPVAPCTGLSRVSECSSRLFWRGAKGPPRVEGHDVERPYPGERPFRVRDPRRSARAPLRELSEHGEVHAPTKKPAGQHCDEVSCPGRRSGCQRSPVASCPPVARAHGPTRRTFDRSTGHPLPGPGPLRPATARGGF